VDSRRPSHGSEKIVEVAAGLVFRDGKLLITQRYAEAHLGGLWEFPGGKREPNESFANCLSRELIEELGIEVEVGELVDTVSHSYPEKTVLLRFYRCKWIRNEPQKLGCANFCWVTRDQIDQYEFPAADARIVQALRDNQSIWSNR
jgi:mutator protein MutT